ncbi:RnfABCDGE type electron transport complex subunit D [Neobacillus ginsengisoli]|uniref:Na+-translocating ferredoxin:NAD+ oxidoreductase RnfD subunit n=1 Tax=Neobacillus ginsengisoli TaxID=904295 RepID=A0ABT9Y2Z6_9BACI|nr:RnfABCDGE type electron transport complex subunit D [Neobacillus ginsengisoli]MDQ0202193.1 Na+-translocating ferredoxin:NAD+ oxidoreductase RnfD subunit [Neobacillus ginsengisoli]
MTIQKWLKTPKGYVAIAMIAYLLIASIGYKNIMGIKNGFVAVIVSVIVDILCNVMKKRKWTIPDGAVITGLIISLILSTATSLSVIAASAVIAILSKHLLVYKKKPIFNPAAFGLLISVLFFRTGQSWWGAFGDLPAWTILFLLVGGYKITGRINKYPQVFSFLGTSFLLLLLMGHFHIGDEVDALRPPFINATLFFGFFMLTDPPTSPAKDKEQVIFGILTAAAGTVIYGLFGGLIYLFIGLCIGNLYCFLKKRSTSKVSMNRSNVKKTERILG